MSLVGPGCAPTGQTIVQAATAVAQAPEPAAPSSSATLCVAPAPPMPAARSNHVLASMGEGDGAWWITGLGIGPARDAGAVSGDLWLGKGSPPTWTSLAPPEGAWAPRLAGQAVAVGGRFLILGGYTVAADGAEASDPRVDAYDPVAQAWSRRAPMPVPVDDSVGLVWRDRYVLLVSGWSQDDNVLDTQLYDSVEDRWLALAPFPAPGRFGHVAAIHGDRILVCDGVTRHDTPPKYRLHAGCTLGELSAVAGEAPELRWGPAPSHPGPGRYRAAAAVLDGFAYFVGGTDNPYNYSGVGYDKRESNPLASIVVWDFAEQRWAGQPEAGPAVMDLRGAAVQQQRIWIFGGMHKGPVVSDQAFVVGPAVCEPAPAVGPTTSREP